MAPPYLRGGGLRPINMGAAGGHGFNKNFDVKEEKNFPDLASADKILEKQQKQVMYRAAPKKNWICVERVVQKPPAPNAKETPAAAAAPAAPAMKKKPKKKKKNLPTFKAS